MNRNIFFNSLSYEVLLFFGGGWSAGDRTWALCLLGKHSNHWAQSPTPKLPFFLLAIFKIFLSFYHWFKQFDFVRGGQRLGKTGVLHMLSECSTTELQQFDWFGGVVLFYFIFGCLLFIVLVLGIEFSALHLLSRHSTTLTKSPTFVGWFFKTASSHVAAGLEFSM